MRSYLKSIGTAVPQYENVQQDIMDFMAEAAEVTQHEMKGLPTSRQPVCRVFARSKSADSWLRVELVFSSVSPCLID